MFFNKKIRILLCVSVIAVTAVSFETKTQEQITGSLAISITGVKDTIGQVCVHIYNDAAAFPDQDRSYKSACGEISNGSSFLVFENLPSGKWAALAFHDENSNKKLDKSFLRRPKEGVGTSRGASAIRGRPNFEDAAFLLDNEKKNISIHLRYF